jgi:NitT/TauT family transport system substrate-binding protein
VRFATLHSGGTAAMYVAVDRGFFQQEGVTLDFVPFSNPADMVPALATNQIETASIGTPAMWNAIARGAGIKLVLDQSTFYPGSSSNALLVRKSVYDAGRGRSLADLPGLTVALAPPGTASTLACALSAALERTGLSLDDLNIQALPFPEMPPALANGAVDAALAAEPFLTRAVRDGIGVKVMDTGEMYPNFTVAVIGFSSAFYADRAVAKRYVRAYVRGVREYNAAIAGQGGTTRAQVNESMARYTSMDLASVSQMVPPGFSPNGVPNRDALLYCYRLFRDRGVITEAVPDPVLADLWAADLVDEVLQELGRLPDK